MADSIAPSLLVAVPQLQDPNFEHTVTLLVEASPEGAFGLVINRVSPIKLADICAQKEVPCTRDLFVRVGGPIEQGRAWVLHGPQAKGETSYPISSEIFLTPTWEMLEKLAVSEESVPFQVYLGYAGWGPGQLERELAEGSWLLAEPDAKFIFGPAGGELWKAVLAKMGLDPGKIAPGGGGVN
jgi:putative transcriptional regulator